MKFTALAICAVLAAAPAAAFAQEAWKAPRTPDGKPDLQGVWTNASLTSLERPANQPLVIPADRAAQMEKQRAQMMAAQNNRTNPAEGAPQAGRDVGGYNTFWIDPGSRYGVVKGETRTSWIVDPPDGRIPYSQAGKEAYERKIQRVRTTFDGPEVRPQGERCIVGFGSTGGPPMINVLYNNHYQIVQTPSHVTIMVEMNHDARIIPISADKGGGKHAPASFRKWLGDSIGWWEGDTLVVETVNFHKDIDIRPNMGASFYVGENAKVTERFTRVGEDAIHYEFTVEDPVAFTRPWKGEMTLRKDSERIYEYACHEGNYALPGILAGARADDKKGVKTIAGDAE
jgi:hypothetical protein